MNERMQGGGGAGSDFGGVGGSDGMSADQHLPTSWMETTLDTLLHRIEAGLNVKCDERPPNVGEKGLVKISAVTWGQFDELQSKTLPASETPVPRNRIQPGDLLISRANTIELVGASVIVKDLQRELYLSDKVLRLVVHEPSKRWINYALKTPALRKAIEEGSSGNQLSMRNISQDKLKALPLPLAPEAEQKRIADKLDTVLTRVDAVITRLARVAPLLKRFRQSVLAAATSGRLTENWRDSESMDSWNEMTCGSVSEFHNGYAFKSEIFKSSGDIQIVKLANIKDGHLKLVASPTYVNASDVIDQLSQQPNPGDVLISMTGTRYKRDYGFVCVVPDDAQLLINQRVGRLVPAPSKVSSKFLMISLMSSDFRDQFFSGETGGVNQGNVGSNHIKSCKILCPPIAEQTEIVRRVETLFALADRLEARLAQAQTAATRLTPALLAKAFRGELVPQDPNDEPAAELLRRLASSPTAPAKRGRAAKAT